MHLQQVSAGTLQPGFLENYRKSRVHGDMPEPFPEHMHAAANWVVRFVRNMESHKGKQARSDCVSDIGPDAITHFNCGAFPSSRDRNAGA